MEKKFKPPIPNKRVVRRELILGNPERRGNLAIQRILAHFNWRCFRRFSQSHLNPNQAEMEPEQLVRKAMKLWRAARDVNLAEEQLTELLDKVFEMSPEEWKAAVDNFRGDETLLKAILSGEGNNVSYNFENQVLRELFPSKGYTASVRLKKVEHLLKFAALTETDFIDWRCEGDAIATRINWPGTGSVKRKNITANDLKGKNLNVSQVRLLVDAQAAMRKRKTNHSS